MLKFSRIGYRSLAIANMRRSSPAGPLGPLTSHLRIVSGPLPAVLLEICRRLVRLLWCADGRDGRHVCRQSCVKEPAARIRGGTGSQPEAAGGHCGAGAARTRQDLDAAAFHADDARASPPEI